MDPDAGGSSSAPPPPSATIGAGAETKEEERGLKQVMVVLVGPPGSGKSTFAEAVVGGSTAGRHWVRVCQDTIGNGKAGTKIQCLKAASDALKEGKSVLIDRCNLEREQRADFVKLGSTLHADVHAVSLDLPAKVCISRAVSRKGHDGNLQGGKAALVVNRMLQKKETPLLTEGFSRIMCCNDDGDIKKAVDLYNGLGPSDSLPSGVFGQKSKRPVQVGIMKFLKKADASSVETSSGPKLALTEIKPVQQNPLPKQENVEAGFACPMEVEKGLNDKMENEEHAKESDYCDVGSRTLAFPSISTADFQFDLDRASDIIVDTAANFLQKFDNIRLVLVDLSEKSRILSLVKQKAAKKSIDSNRFFTYVGDITQLHTRGGLQCSVIGNAANWRLKPGGGGVNAAIYNAAGESLQHATKKCADALRPGTSVVVPLPSTSPLRQREGVTHVIHVLGPNMNPMRPDYLKNDYTRGSKILREAYNSLFENFASIVQSYMGKQNSESGAEKSASGGTSPNDTKMKREDSHGSERMKKHKLFQPIMTAKQQHECTKVNAPNCHDDAMTSSVVPSQTRQVDNKRNDVVTSKTWGSWAQSLYELAMNPEKYKNSDSILETSDEYIVLKDLYPKAKRHILVISRMDGLDSLADVKKEHLPLLRRMHSAGVKWAQKFLEEDAALEFRLGYHSVPSMRQLHLHIISQDFNSASLKNKKHWNSFTTSFFRDSVDVIEEIEQNGSTTTSSDEKDGTYKCAVTITSIANNNNWWYISCVPCKKRAEQQLDHTYKCPKCQGYSVIPRYLLGFTARDDTGEARFFAYDEEAKLIVEKNCDAIINPLAVAAGLPPALQRIINKRYVFSVDLTDDSCRSQLRRQYLVKSVLERPRRHAPAPTAVPPAGPSTSSAPSSSTQAGISAAGLPFTQPEDHALRIQSPKELTQEGQSEILQLEFSTQTTPAPTVDPKQSPSKDVDTRFPPKARRNLFEAAKTAENEAVHGDELGVPGPLIDDQTTKSASPPEPKPKRAKASGDRGSSKDTSHKSASGPAAN